MPMKTDIHPTYYPEAKVVCNSCKATFVTGSTLEELQTELCSNCHPFYTGKQMLVDTAGTVDKFRKRSEAAAKLKSVVVEKKPRKTREKKTV